MIKFETFLMIGVLMFMVLMSLMVAFVKPENHVTKQQLAEADRDRLIAYVHKSIRNRVLNVGDNSFILIPYPLEKGKKPMEIKVLTDENGKPTEVVQ